LNAVYNLEAGEAYAFDTVVDRINEGLRTSIEPECIENLIPDSVYVHDTCADLRKMHDATGWTPKIDFEEVSIGSVLRIRLPECDTRVPRDFSHMRESAAHYKPSDNRRL
jgi:hypothetical protein